MMFTCLVSSSVLKRTSQLSGLNTLFQQQLQCPAEQLKMNLHVMSTYVQALKASTAVGQDLFMHACLRSNQTFFIPFLDLDPVYLYIYIGTVRSIHVSYYQYQLCLSVPCGHLPLFYDRLIDAQAVFSSVLFDITPSCHHCGPHGDEIL